MSAAQLGPPMADPAELGATLAELGATLADLDRGAIAGFLAGLGWSDRAAWLDRRVDENLSWLGHHIGRVTRDLASSRDWSVDMAELLRETIGAVLDRLDHREPLPLDPAALALYRASDDPGRVEQARLAWRARSAEDAALLAYPGLTALRDLTAAGEAWRAEENARRMNPRVRA